MDPSRRLTVLILDGGGVRGISSLLILQELMSRINQSLISRGYDGNALLPRDVFGFAAGTSTGGLIAIMLMRLGMTIPECIEAYRRLSRRIFKKKRIRGLLTGGLYRPRYYGSTLVTCVRELLREQGLDADEVLTADKYGKGGPKKACSVVCREEEHEYKRRISSLRRHPFFFCSVHCGHEFEYKTCEAARATTAAWSYFSAIKIGEKFFSDGGLEYNNPSYVIWAHYTESAMVKRNRERYQWTVVDMPPVATHCGLDFSVCRMVNIGTGSQKEGETPAQPRSKSDRLKPTWIANGIFAKERLTEIATAAEGAAGRMMGEVQTRRGKLSFDRLSATNGVCWVKLDKHQRIPEIEQLTGTWLHFDETQRYMGELAAHMAQEYLEDHPIPTRGEDHPFQARGEDQPTEAGEELHGGLATSSLPTGQRAGSSSQESHASQREVPHLQVHRPDGPATASENSPSPSPVTPEESQQAPSFLTTARTNGKDKIMHRQSV